MASNALLVRWSGGWREVIDADSISERGRREALLGLGAVQSAGEVDSIAKEELRLFASERAAIAIDIDPTSDDDIPGAGFQVGDMVPVPDRFLTSSNQRCVSITLTENADGDPTYAAEFNDIILEAQERFEQTLEKMANGTLSGQSKVATAVSSITPSGPNCCLPSVPEGGG